MKRIQAAEAAEAMRVGSGVVRPLMKAPSAPLKPQQASCRECGGAGYLPRAAMPANLAQILSECFPCDCPAGDWFRAEIAIQGEHCDARGCTAEAAEAVRGIRLCAMHRLTAVDAWRAAGGRDWVAAFERATAE